MTQQFLLQVVLDEGVTLIDDAKFVEMVREKVRWIACAHATSYRVCFTTPIVKIDSLPPGEVINVSHAVYDALELMRPDDTPEVGTNIDPNDPNP